MITLSALTVLGREPEMKAHVRGALNIGISRATLEEMMIHLAHYGGWPVGVAGLRIVREVAEEMAKSGTTAFDAIGKT